MSQLIGILGGTFDPIHNGHLHIAQTVLIQAHLNAIQFIPCNIPPHRQQPKASSTDRYNMLQLSIENNSAFSINPIEIQRPGPSYAIDTLKTLKTTTNTLCFILGVDSFLTFNLWYQWQNILNYCHLIVVNRPSYNFELNEILQPWYQQHHINNPLDLKQKSSGYIFKLDIPPSPISATQIRLAMQNQQNVDNLIPHNVLEYIKKHAVYE